MFDESTQSYGGWSIRPDGDGPWLAVTSLDDFEPPEYDPRHPPLPNPLNRILFGPIDPDPAEIAAWGVEPIPEAATYALIDASTTPMLIDRLESSGLEHRCLFSGKALRELGHAAPWIVKLEPGNPFVTALLSRGGRGAGLWDNKPGIFLRARVPMDALYTHFRHFTRLKDETGTWFFNRFWGPSVSTTLLSLGNDAALSPFVSPLFPAGRDALRLIVLCPHGHMVLSRIPGTLPPHRRPILTGPVKGWMRHIRRVQQFEELIAIALRHVEAGGPVDHVASAAHLRTFREDYFDIGFWRRDHLVSLCVWELMLGPNFVETFAGGEIRRIIQTSPSDWEAIERIDHFLDPPPPEPTEAEVRAMQLADQLKEELG